MASDDEEANAMALAMGFSTFGTKPSAKKRRFNPSTDAFVEGQDLEKLDRGGKKGKGTGGNMIPVGVRKTRIPSYGGAASMQGGSMGKESIGKTVQAEDNMRRPIPSARISPERSLSDTEDAPNYMDTSRPPPITRKSPERSDEEEEDGPRYMDTSEAAPITQKSEPISRGGYISTTPSIIAPSILSMRLPPPINPPLGLNETTFPIQPSPPGASVLSSHTTAHSPPPGISQPITQMSPPPGLPTKPPPGLPPSNFRGTSPSDSSHSNKPGNNRGGGFQKGGRRGFNEKWYEGYYDVTFNQNPWEALEVGKGLSSVGSWLPGSNQQKGRI
ncbi:hypothetical protein HYALB_00002986 [Hymenoscyphus albidus]|uniref:Uncharacterized protein n=1 Tax=Hymenoscyphus albidus TaxID=595503 RepID=A0A9N9Q8M7_9HELO|nr:hypothetical protein HYALB_00002986 [Hymenoscyphus albidus]